MGETFTLIGGRSSRQGTALCVGKLGSDMPLSKNIDVEVEAVR